MISNTDRFNHTKQFYQNTFVTGKRIDDVCEKKEAKLTNEL